MNKKLIAMAIAAGLAAPMAAQADATVYGKINMGFGTTDNGATAAPNSFMGVYDYDSRFGFKGSEDLGGGLSAYFKMETAIDMDDNGGVSFARDLYAGVKGGFGSIQVGQYNTAYKNVYGKLDIFADSIGDITGTGTHGELDDRQADMLTYSNTFGAISLAVDYLSSETDGTTADDGMAIGVTWKGNGMMAVVGLVDKDSDQQTSNSNAYDEGTRLGFQWTGGAHKVNVLHESIDKTAANADYDVTTVQYAMNMGKNMFGVSYTMTDRDAATADSTQLTVGVHHKLSKKTKVALTYTSIDNDANSGSTGRIFNSSLGSAGANGDDPSQLGVMMTHNF